MYETMSKPKKNQRLIKLPKISPTRSNNENHEEFVKILYDKNKHKSIRNFTKLPAIQNIKNRLPNSKLSNNSEKPKLLSLSPHKVSNQREKMFSFTKIAEKNNSNDYIPSTLGASLHIRKSSYNSTRTQSPTLFKNKICKDLKFHILNEGNSQASQYYEENICLEEINFIEVIGSGLFGIIKLAKWKRYPFTPFAIKSYNKALIKFAHQKSQIINERESLKILSNHPFIIK